MMNFLRYIQSYPDFPKPGVLFWDFGPLLAEPKGFKQAILKFKAHYCKQGITHIVAIEAKGFTLGAALAYEMGLPLILVRKQGLIPGDFVQAPFIKEYGEAVYELKAGSLNTGAQVLIVYDILAGPGATEAAIDLVRSQGSEVLGCAYVLELEYLSGRQALKQYDVFSLVKIKARMHKVPVA